MRRGLLATILLVIVPPTARSQAVEVTPLVGYRVGGSFATEVVAGDTTAVVGYEVEDAASFGVHLGFRVSRDGEIEALYSRQPTRLATGGLFIGAPLFDLALETWQAGGNYLFAEEDSRVRPYIGVGLGVTRLLPEPADLRDETRFSASFAVGTKVWLGRHVGLRVEARGFFTFLEREGETFCRTAEGCRIHSEGADISQADLRAGLVLRF